MLLVEDIEQRVFDPCQCNRRRGLIGAAVTSSASQVFINPGDVGRILTDQVWP